MLAPLAIALLGLAAANDREAEVSMEERFRLLYALGDKIGAYGILLGASESSSEYHKFRDERLVPLLIGLTNRLQTRTMLEDLCDDLEEIESVLCGWGLVAPDRGILGYRISEIIDFSPRFRRVSSDWQGLNWHFGPNPREKAEMPVLVDWLVDWEWPRGHFKKDPLAWDHRGRLLVDWVDENAKPFPHHQFAIVSVSEYDAWLALHP